jgi:magnesium chelatase family protein
MLVKIFGSAVFGVNAITITIEVNWMESNVGVMLVGLPDGAVKESLQRVESALGAIGHELPRTRLVVNLAPADLRKSGAAFDLPIALGIMAAAERIAGPERLERYVIMGELSLDGTLRSVRGALPMALQAKREGFKGLLVPAANAREAAMVDGLHVYGVKTLKEVLEFFENDEQGLERIQVDLQAAFAAAQERSEIDFAEVKGQENIKRALEIAAAGGHNAILIGPPGAGKTMLARRLPTILPPLTLLEALETTKIHSVAGKLPEGATLVATRPFRSPHHTISDVALVGGGSIPQPGKFHWLTTAFLPRRVTRIKRTVLEVMRQPMEERRVSISRARVAVDFPASFMLIASMNPCPCGTITTPNATAAAAHSMCRNI